MQEVINKVMLAFGASEPAARAAAACLLRVIHSGCSAEQARTLHQRLQGVTRLLADAPSIVAPGDLTEELATARSALSNDGIAPQRTERALTMLASFLVERLGEQAAALVTLVRKPS